MIIHKSRYKRLNFLLSYVKMLFALSWEKLYSVLLFKKESREVSNMIPTLVVTQKSGDSCQSCSICQDFCPEGSILREKGILRLDLMSCSYCQYCVSVCPEQKLELKKVDFIFLPINKRYQNL